MSLLTTGSALSVGLSREADVATGKDSEEWGVLLLTSAFLFFFSFLRCFSLLALAVSELSFATVAAIGTRRFLNGYSHGWSSFLIGRVFLGACPLTSHS